MAADPDGAFRDEPLFARLILAFFVNSAANALPAGLFLFYVGERLGAPAWGGPLLGRAPELSTAGTTTKGA